MQPIENKKINRVYGKGRGWAFFKNDFVDLGNAAAIDQALSRLAKSQRIRRVMRGIYLVGKHELSFKKASLKDMGLKYPESALLVQAIKSLNKGHMGSTERKQIRAYFETKDGSRILKDTRYITSWVHDEIKRIFKEHM